mmetsp:Transcript_19896/g.24560  ORF Transcript_19896/g.24560 Transcript_19896/m.24560 type:complete len:85 (+) Transcript_19896:54-308(+)
MKVIVDCALWPSSFCPPFPLWRTNTLCKEKKSTDNDFVPITKLAQQHKVPTMWRYTENTHLKINELQAHDACDSKSLNRYRFRT